MILPGPVTEHDIIRVLPFGGRVVGATFTGALLARVLETGVNNEGTGGYLHAWGVRWQDGQWHVQGKPIDPAARYGGAHGLPPHGRRNQSRLSDPFESRRG